MIDYSISWGPFLIVALVNFFGSWIYYSPVSPFFKIWQKGVGIDSNQKGMSDDQKKAMPRLMIGAVVGTLLFAYGMQVLAHSLGVSTIMDGMKLGFVAWFAFAVTHSLNTQFEGRRPVVLFINDLWFLITYIGFGALLATWK